jgi:hypothetical protein
VYSCLLYKTRVDGDGSFNFKKKWKDDGASNTKGVTREVK